MSEPMYNRPNNGLRPRGRRQSWAPLPDAATGPATAAPSTAAPSNAGPANPAPSNTPTAAAVAEVAPEASVLGNTMPETHAAPTASAPTSPAAGLTRAQLKAMFHEPPVPTPVSLDDLPLDEPEPALAPRPTLAPMLHADEVTPSPAQPADDVVTPALRLADDPVAPARTPVDITPTRQPVDLAVWDLGSGKRLPDDSVSNEPEPDDGADFIRWNPPPARTLPSGTWSLGQEDEVAVAEADVAEADVAAADAEVTDVAPPAAVSRADRADHAERIADDWSFDDDGTHGTEWSLNVPAPVAPASSSTPVVEQLFPDQDLTAALQHVLDANGSDLHITVGAAPRIRVSGGLSPIEGAPRWMREKVTAALYSILTQKQRERFETELELDFAYATAGARFRVNYYRQRNSLGAAFRLIPRGIKPLRELGVPESVGRFAELARGLVLVTGPTGSGKSTTLAALIDLINRTRADHIVTVEDPIEFLHTHQKSLVNQREVGHDTHSFAAALKHVLRQDPDVILIGELRDLETIQVALTAAETGHLVFATLHTQDAPQTIDRIIDVFPPEQQETVRAQLAATLQGVVCQTLVKKATGKGRVVATEVLVTTPAVSNLIREGKTYQIPSAMQAGRDLGMYTMDQHLAELVDNGKIKRADAMEKAHDAEGLRQLIQRPDLGGEGFDQMSAPNYEFNSATATTVDPYQRNSPYIGNGPGAYPGSGAH